MNQRLFMIIHGVDVIGLLQTAQNISMIINQSQEQSHTHKPRTCPDMSMDGIVDATSGILRFAARKGNFWSPSGLWQKPVSQ